MPFSYFGHDPRLRIMMVLSQNYNFSSELDEPIEMRSDIQLFIKNI